MTTAVAAPSTIAYPLRVQTPRNVLLIYGPPAGGKSTQLALRAAQRWKKHGTKSRVIGLDPGGTVNALQALIDKGIVQYMAADLWAASPKASVFTLLDQLTKGYWPADHNMPGSPLLPSVKEWKPCTFCGKDSGALFHAMVKECASCKKPFPPGTTLSTRRDPINGLEEIGMIGFDSLTTAGVLLTDYLRKINPEGGRVVLDLNEEEREAYAKCATEEAQKKFIAALPREKKIPTLSQAHYQDAQTKIRELVTNVKQIPVEEVIFTALEVKTAPFDGSPVYGPDLPGKALSKKCIPWFTAVGHLDAIEKRVGGQLAKDAATGTQILDYNLYFAPHFALDNPSQRWEAKSSAPFGGEMPTVFAGRDVRLYFEALEKAHEKAAEALLA